MCALKLFKCFSIVSRLLREREGEKGERGEREDGGGGREIEGRVRNAEGEDG